MCPLALGRLNQRYLISTHFLQMNWVPSAPAFFSQAGVNCNVETVQAFGVWMWNGRWYLPADPTAASPATFCPDEHTHLSWVGSKLQGRNRWFAYERARMVCLRLNLSCFYMMTVKTIGMQTEGPNIAAKSLLVS